MKQRKDRRHALLALVCAAMATAAMAGCGGGDELCDTPATTTAPPVPTSGASGAINDSPQQQCRP